MLSFEELFAKRATVIKPGLDRIRQALLFLPAGIAKRDGVIIGGTNGKGTTSGYLWQLLTQGGLRSGLFSSPHLRCFSERFELPERAGPLEVHATWDKIRAMLPQHLYDELSFFELATLIAMMMFAEHATDCDVWEVGLGGRWDSTNVSDPLASAIVSIGRDHEEFLGSTIAQIALEKFGIARPRRPLFLGQMMYPEASETITKLAADLDTPIYRYGHEFGILNDMWFAELPDCERIEMPLPAEIRRAVPYLKHNFAVAAALYHWLARQRTRALKPISEVDFSAGRRARCSLGRFEKLVWTEGSFEVNALFDVCHNPDGVDAFHEAMLHEFGENTKPFCFPGLVSILSDKDVNGMLDKLKRFLKPLVIFKINHPRGLSREHLALRHQDVPILSSWDDALKTVVNQSMPRTRPLVVCGSVMAVGQVIEQLAAAHKANIVPSELH